MHNVMMKHMSAGGEERDPNLVLRDLYLASGGSDEAVAGDESDGLKSTGVLGCRARQGPEPRQDPLAPQEILKTLMARGY